MIKKDSSSRGERIKTIRKELKMSQKDMASTLGIQQSTYSHIETGNRSNITLAHVETLVDKYGVNPYYILNGFYPIFASSYQGGPNESHSGPAITNVNDKKLSASQPFGKPMLLVPISARASYGISWPEDQDKWEDYRYVIVPGMDVEGRVFEVEGESMTPVLLHGDFVACILIEDGRLIRDGVLYVIVTRSNGISVKYLRRSSEGMVCISENHKDHPEYILDYHDVLEVWEVKLRITTHVLAQRFYMPLETRVDHELKAYLKRLFDTYK